MRSSFLKILDSFHQHENKMIVISYVKDEALHKVPLNDDDVVRNVEISREFFCSSNKTIRADRKACRHIIWRLNKIRLIELDDDIIGWIYLEDYEIRDLKIPDILRESLKKVNAAKRNFHHKIKSHQKSLEKSKWFIGVKSSNIPATCSGCLKKGVIKYGSLYLYTKGILYLHKYERVVETTLRFCFSKFCVTNITSTLNNIKPFIDDVVYKDQNLIHHSQFGTNILFLRTTTNHLVK